MKEKNVEILKELLKRYGTILHSDILIMHLRLKECLCAEEEQILSKDTLHGMRNIHMFEMLFSKPDEVMNDIQDIFNLLRWEDAANFLKQKLTELLEKSNFYETVNTCDNSGQSGNEINSTLAYDEGRNSQEKKIKDVDSKPMIQIFSKGTFEGENGYKVERIKTNENESEIGNKSIREKNNQDLNVHKLLFGVTDLGTENNESISLTLLEIAENNKINASHIQKDLSVVNKNNKNWRSTFMTFDAWKSKRESEERLALLDKGADEHSLEYDHNTRRTNLNYLKYFTNGEELKLCWVESHLGKLTFQHWFVTNGKVYLEFGGLDLNINTARVNINTLVRHTYVTERKYEMTDIIRQRMQHVLGLRNYSLSLRNCEHVANYVFYGKWISRQTMDDGHLMKSFQNELKVRTERLQNSFPTCFRAPVIDDNKRCVYPKTFISNNKLSDPFNATGVQYYLDENEDTYNILVVGPTEVGKSHLINVLFNQHICDSSWFSREMDMKEIYFIHGTGTVWNIAKDRYENRQIVVANTAGFFDRDLDDDRVFRFIKGRVSPNMRFIDAVFVVFSARNRMITRHILNIKKIMEWLKYNDNNNDRKFRFVGTYGGHLKDEDKIKIIKEASENLGLQEKHFVIRSTTQAVNPVFITGFPMQGEDFTQKQKLDICESWKNLHQHIENPGYRLDISGTKCNIL